VIRKAECNDYSGFDIDCWSCDYTGVRNGGIAVREINLWSVYGFEFSFGNYIFLNGTL